MVAVARAGSPSFHELDEGILDEIRDRFAHELFAEDEAFWEERRQKRFASLIPLQDVVETPDVDVPKRDRRGWVTIREGQSSCLLSPAS